MQKLGRLVFMLGLGLAPPCYGRTDIILEARAPDVVLHGCKLLSGDDLVSLPHDKPTGEVCLQGKLTTDRMQSEFEVGGQSSVDDIVISVPYPNTRRQLFDEGERPAIIRGRFKFTDCWKPAPPSMVRTCAPAHPIIAISAKLYVWTMKNSP